MSVTAASLAALAGAQEPPAWAGSRQGEAISQSPSTLCLGAVPSGSCLPWPSWLLQTLTYPRLPTGLLSGEGVQAIAWAEPRVIT